MIYLIGGPPRVGKSTAAKLLSEKLSVPYLATDDLQKVIRAYVPVEEYPEKLPFHFIEAKAEYNNDQIYATHSTSELVAAYIKQSAFYWTGFKQLITYFLKENRNYIIEGHILHPAFLQELAATDLLKIAYLYKSDRELVVDGLHKNQAEHDWVLERTTQAETFERLATTLIEYGEYLRGQAQVYELPYFEMSQKFQEKIAEVVEFLAT